MAGADSYRRYQGMDFAEIPADILDRDTSPMFAYRDMDHAEHAAQLKRDAAYNN